jgi:hypothetical protein
LPVDDDNRKTCGRENSQGYLPDDDPIASVVRYWEHTYGDPDKPKTYLNIFYGKRPRGEQGKVNKGRYKDQEECFYSWPDKAEQAARDVLEISEKGHNVYSCAHLLVKPKRKKENASSIICLYADGDGAEVPGWMDPPTLTVESSPGRHQYWWRLDRRMAPEEAEKLNRLLTYKIGADKGCWNLARVLRIPGTKNYDYAEVYDEVPIIRVVV